MRSLASFQTLQGARPACRNDERLCIRINARSRGRRWPSFGQTKRSQGSMIRHQRQKHDWGINAEGSSLEGGAAQVAMNGDTVFIHYICRDEDGNVVDDSAESEDHPVSFEVGAGEITGNPLFQAFDEAIRGLPLGSTTVLEARGGDWNRELFFEVPRDHAEIQRLEGRYKNQGGLQDGLIVELSNGGSAMVVAVTDDVVKIDANNMLAGKRRIFEVTLMNIEPAQR